MKIITLLLAVALGVLGMYHYKNIAAAQEQAAVAQRQYQEARTELETVRNDAADLKTRFEEAQKQLAETKEKSKAAADELAALKIEFSKAARDATSGKDVAAEVTELRKQVLDLRIQVDKAQNETALTKGELAQSRAETQRLQEAQKKPPLGSAMTRKP